MKGWVVPWHTRSLPSGTFGSVVIHNPTDLPPLETTANSIMAKAIEWEFIVQPKPFVTRTRSQPRQAFTKWKPPSTGVFGTQC